MTHKQINYQYSIIIPHYKIIDLLSRALQSIPDREYIQIIVVDDNSGIDESEFEKLNFFKHANCQFVFTRESKGAGYVRNVGLSLAKGKWLLFLDADDFFTNTAFEFFDEYVNSNHDIIYFNTKSVFSETLQPSDRFSLYKAYIETAVNTNAESLNILKFAHSVPVAKMVRRAMVDENKIVFDETRYCNDSMFAVRSAIAANSLYVDQRIVYVVTEREGSLVTNPTLEAIKIRYEVQLRVNQLIRSVGMSKYQNSLLAYLSQSIKFGFNNFCHFIILGFKYSGLNIHSLYLARKRVKRILDEYNKKK